MHGILARATMPLGAQLVLLARDRLFGGVTARIDRYYNLESNTDGAPIVLQSSMTSQSDDSPFIAYDEDSTVPDHSQHSPSPSLLSSEDLDALHSPFDLQSATIPTIDTPNTIQIPSDCRLRDRSPIPYAKAHPCALRQISVVHSNGAGIQQQTDSISEISDSVDYKEEICSDDSDAMTALIDAEEKGLYQLNAMDHPRGHQSISDLLHIPLTDEARDILGDPSTYSIPKSKSELSRLQRDLKKIKTSLREIEDDEQRDYAKISILKHYDLLVLLYKKYCKIGGDMKWLNMKGFMAMMRDARLIGDNDEDRQLFINLFHRIHNDHHSSSAGHSVQLTGLYGDECFHDDNPWSGLWVTEDEWNRVKQLEQNEESGVPTTHLQRGYSSDSASSGGSVDSNNSLRRFKIRKVGDKRIVGCIDGTDYVSINGQLMKHDFKRSRLDIRFQRKSNATKLGSHRVWDSLMVPSTSSQEPITMKIKWEQHNEGSAATKHGHLKLFKLSQLEDDDEDLPVSQFMGLSRFEYFDALLAASQVVSSSMGSTGKDLYALFDQLVSDHFDAFIYQNTMDIRPHVTGKTISDDIVKQMRSYHSVLVRLCKAYASLENVGDLRLDPFAAMAIDICQVATIHDRSVWDKGGKPSLGDIENCFYLSKGVKQLHIDEIDFTKFLKSLVYFAGAIYPKEPNTKYELMSFESKMDLVLKWCSKLDCQISSKGYNCSASYRYIKRQRLMKTKNSMTGSNALEGKESLSKSTRRMCLESK